MRTWIKILAKSPFGRLGEHMIRVHECVVLIKPLFQAMLKGDYEEVGKITEQISKLEHKADVIKNEIRSHLPKSIFLPVDRGDVLKFLRQQDAIADAVEDVSVLLTLKRLPVPEEIKGDIMILVDRVLDTCDSLIRVTGEISNLMESTFSGPEADRVLQLIDEVGNKEWEADKAQIAVAKKMLSLEDSVDPVSIYMWMKVFENLGEIANHAENTADGIRMMMAKA